MNAEFLPCPFCGGKAAFIKGAPYPTVECSECGVNTGDCITKNVAADAWNQRTHSQYRDPTIEDAREFERIYWGSGVNIRLSCLEILNQLGFVRKVTPNE